MLIQQCGSKEKERKCIQHISSTADQEGDGVIDQGVDQEVGTVFQRLGSERIEKQYGSHKEQNQLGIPYEKHGIGALTGKITHNLRYTVREPGSGMIPVIFLIDSELKGIAGDLIIKPQVYKVPNRDQKQPDRLRKKVLKETFKLLLTKHPKRLIIYEKFNHTNA